MSNKVYTKDDGTDCELCKDQSGFCHIHSEADESGDSRFSVLDGANYCTQCESPITTHSAAFKPQQFNEHRVNVMIVLGCECHVTEIPMGVNHIAKDTLPEKWYGTS